MGPWGRSTARKPEDKMDRVFVEWFDEARPGLGGYISTLDREFLSGLAEGIALYGRPTKVEFRAADEGWVRPCPGCNYSDCKCPQV